MIRNLKSVPMIIAAAGMAASIMAVGPQTTQDRAEGNRLVINGQPLFISGMNIAWNSFANDVGDNSVQISQFVNQFKQIKGAGGNAVRWWLHTDGQKCPKFNDQTGAVTGLGSKTISNVQQVLDSAYAYGIVVSLCLFSFDLLQNDNNKTATQMDRNEKFLTVPANLDSYINNALKPLLAAVGNHPAIMCWEVFNEPEGMSSDAGGWATKKIAMSHILRFTAKIAAEVHRSTKKMASTGIHEYGKMKTYYSDAKLKTASGNNDALAYLDFYMAHYYPEYIGASGSPFHHPASFWNMDRPILIGEFPAQSWGPGTNYNVGQASSVAMTITAAYEYAYDNGYCGAMSWSMTEGDKQKFGSFTTTQPALQNLYNKHKTDIEVDRSVVIPEPPEPPQPPEPPEPPEPPQTGSNLAMKLALTNLPKEVQDVGPWNELSLEPVTHDFTGKANFSFEMYIEPSSGGNLMVVPVVKTGGDWVWSPAQDYSFMLSDKPKGQWFTVTVPVSAFKASEAGKVADPSQVQGIILQYFAKDSDYTGTIYIDNIKLDNEVLYNFDEEGSEWSTDGDGALVSITARPGTSSIFHRGKTAAAPTSRSPSVVVKGKILSVVSAGNSDMRIKMVDMRGKTVANFKSSGSGQFSLTNIPAGRYLVETRIAGKKVGNNAIIVK